MWGVREVKENKELVGGKYHWLDENDISSTEWEIIKPEASFYLLKNQNTALLPEYEKGWKIVDIMCVNSTGVKNSQRSFCFDFDFESLYKRIEDFRNIQIADKEIGEKYNIKDTRDWSINQKRKSLLNNCEWKVNFTKCLYRPFDLRNYYHHEDVVELPRNEVVRNILLGYNLTLLYTRPLSPNYEFRFS